MVIEELKIKIDRTFARSKKIVSMSSFVEELRWRGMLHDMMPGTEDLLAKESVAGYIGFDPTADSLGVGNLVQIMTLVHFQRHGHKPVVLVGGATGLVGDPSGKSQERQLLDRAALTHNLQKQEGQLRRFLDFENGPNAAQLVNNYDWFKDMNFLEFIRDVGKHISVNYMLAKDSVKSRLEVGMSFTEFSYQLIQGYDFYHLHRSQNVKLQMGGSDQWGNITTGTELVRRKGGGEAFALTTPLIKKADGTKFGKSEKGNVWLDPEKTSPYEFYQFWLNAADEDAENFTRVFSLGQRETIEQRIADHRTAPHERKLQKALAEEVTERVHGYEALALAQKASAILFGQATEQALRELDSRTIEQVFKGVPQGKVLRDSLLEGLDVVDFALEHAGAFPSKGQARKMIAAGGFSINKTKVDMEKRLGVEDIVAGRFILAQRGKKNYFLIEVQA